MVSGSRSCARTLLSVEAVTSATFSFSEHCEQTSVFESQFSKAPTVGALECVLCSRCISLQSRPAVAGTQGFEPEPMV